jgi:tetratricopeptide (TPR) repeat protein/serine/threonine protein kinase
MTDLDKDAEAVFLAALDRAAGPERAAYVGGGCAGRPDLLRRVRELLAAHEGSRGPLDAPPAGPGATADVPRPAGPAGGVVGPYKLLERIGEGGMGTVWLAEQTEPVRRRVALKVIKPGMDSAQVIARFEAERQALALMDHPHIARVLDAGATPNGWPYFVMDLVKGVPITRYCDEHRLTPRQRLELFIPVCQAVQHAHQKGIIHRDLKPSNVLVALYDGKPVPKVIDFGVAKAAGQPLTDKTLVTGFGAIVGTLEYMSPEQAEVNQLDIDTRSDVYSLGVLLYELLTGSPPFTKKDLEKAGMLEMLRMIREQEPSKPSTKLSSSDALPTLSANRGTEPAKLTRLVRGELDWIVMKALEKDRGRRYETANGFAQDVQRYLADEPVQACPPSASYRLGKFARRNRGGLAVAALVLFFLVLLGSGAGWAVRDRSARQAEAARQQGERQAKVAGQVESILGEVVGLEKEQKWPEALEAARRAEAAVAGGEADPATADRVHQRLRGLQFIDRLEQIRMELATQVEAVNVLPLTDRNRAVVETDQNYDRAFRDYGVDIDELPVETSIDRLKARPELAIALAAALDDWVYVRRQVSEADVARWKRLVAVARGIDPEPLRDQIRATWDQPAANVRDDVRRLADSIDVRVQHPATLISVARGLKDQHKDAAVRILQEARQLHPGDFWLNFELGDLLFQHNDREGAIRFLTAAVAIRPRSSRAHSKLGIALLFKDRVDEAIAESKKVIELAPQWPTGYLLLDRALQRKGGVDDVIAAWQRVVERDPKNARCHTWLGLALKRKGDLEEAYTEFRTATQLDPKDAMAHSNLSVALVGKGRVDEAIAESKKVIELWPTWLEGYEDLDLALQRKGGVDDAIAEWKKVVERDPRNARCHTWLGLALERKGDLKGAYAEYRKAIEYEPRSYLGWDQLRRALQIHARADEAIAQWKKVIELDPKNFQGYYRLGLTLQRFGRWDEEIAAWRKVIELSPNFVWVRNDIGLALRNQGRVDEAIAEYRKALEKRPTDVEIHINLADALRAKGQLDEAVAEYRKAVELEPKYATAPRNLILALERKGCMEEAIAFRKKLIERDPKNAAEHYHLGNALKAKGDLDGAEAAYREAVRLDGNRHGAAIDALAELLLSRGKVKEAVATYRRSVALDPENASAHRGLGNALKAKGDLDEAVAAYRAAAAAHEKKNPADANSLYNAACYRGQTAAAQARARGPDAARLAKEEADRAMAWLTKAVAAGFADFALLDEDTDLDSLRDREDFRKLLADLPPLAKARYYILRSQWDKAAAVYAKADLLARPLKDDAFACACLLLIRGDSEGYNGCCQEMLRRAGQTDDPYEAYVLARTCAITRKSPVDPVRAVEWGKQAVARDQAAWYFHALGLAQYRAGQFDQALQSFAKADVEAWAYRDLNWFGLALVHHRLGHPDEARRCLDKGVQWLEREGPPGPGRPANIHPMDWVEAQLLRREAEEMLKEKRSP